MALFHVGDQRKSPWCVTPAYPRGSITSNIVIEANDGRKFRPGTQEHLIVFCPQLQKKCQSRLLFACSENYKPGGELIRQWLKIH